MNDINASSNLRLSREMYTALFKNSQAYYLVDEILADGKVNPGKTGDGQSDAAALTKLRAHLEAAAKANDKKLSPDETALLNALDAGSRDGASADVVLKNLSKIQELQKQVAENGLDPTQVSFELLTQTYAEKVQGSSHSLSLSADSQAAQAGSVGAEAGLSTDCRNNSDEEMARQHLISPVRVAQGQAVDQLKHEAGQFQALLKKPAQTPDSRLRQDLTRLAGCVDEDNAYVRQVLDSIGLKQAQLEKKGVLKPGDPDGLNDQRLKDFLASPAFSEGLTPAAVNGYRKLLIDTLGNYAKDPSQAKFDQMREIVYDHSYVFESPEGVGAEAVEQYKQFKQTILNVSQQTNLLDKLSQPENLPASMQALRSELKSSQESATADTLRLAGQVSSLLEQLEANPELFPGVDCSQLRSQLEGLVSRDDAGKLTGLKNPPPGQEHLNLLNQLWAEVEAIGLKAGLGDEFSSGGAINKALERAVAKNPAAAEDPAIKLLQAAPELAEYSDLLSQLSQPENRAMLEALLNNKGEDVSKYFSEYSSRYFDFSSMLGSIGSGFGAGMAVGGLTGGLIGGGLSLGLSYGRSLFGSQNPGTGSSLNNFSFGNLSLGNLSHYGFGTGQPAGPELTPPAASGKTMRLAGMSQTDVEAVMKLLAEKPAARELLQSQGSDLGKLLQATSAGSEIRSAITAKQAFDEAFWSNSSSLEDAQASVQGAMAARSNAQISLTQAGIAVKSALETPNLDPAVQHLLETQKGQIEAALSALSSGQPLPETSPDLEKTIEAVRASSLEAGVTASEAVVNHAQKFLSSQAVEPLLQELSAAFANGQMQQLLDKLPQQQREQLLPLVSNKEGNLSGESLLKRMRSALNSPGTTPDLANQLTANLEALSGLLHKAKEPGCDSAALAAYGRQMLESKAPMPGSPFDLLSDMRFMQESMRELRSTVGKDGMHETATQFLNESRKIMQEMTAQNPGQAVDREALHARMRQTLKSIESDSLNQSLLEGLMGPPPEAVGETEAPTQASVAESLMASPLAQTALQTVFSRVNQGLANNQEIKPIIERLSKGNAAAMGEIQALISKGNPASFNQELQELLAKHLNKNDAQKLQQALVGEIDKQLGDYIGQAEKALGNYSRTDTRRAQTDLIEAMKAYKSMVGISQELNQSNQRVHQAAADSAKSIGYNAGQLLSQPGMLPEGVKSDKVFFTIFPSLLQKDASETQITQELAAFLEMNQAQLEEKLGTSLTPEQFMAIKLSASSLATARFLQDPVRGPAARALTQLVQNAIQHPETLSNPAKRQQLQAMLSDAGKIHDAASRDAFLSKLASFDPEAAKAGTDSVSDLNTSADVEKRSRNLSQDPASQTSETEKSGTRTDGSQTDPKPGDSTDKNAPPSDSTQTDPAASSKQTDQSGQDQGQMSDVVNGFAEGLGIKDSSVPANPGQPLPPPIKFNIRPSQISPELTARLWKATTDNLDTSLTGFLDLPPTRRRPLQANLFNFTDGWRKSQKKFGTVVQKENKHRCELVQEWVDRWKCYSAIAKHFAMGLNGDPKKLVLGANANKLKENETTEQVDII
ncbi:MAG TPA: hypothetical protein V6D23_18690, partial [Candidatus Obscuribacterales bacterium]